MDSLIKCPQCGCERFRFRLPPGKRVVGPINEKVVMIVNLLTDPEFKELGEPPLTMRFSCAECGWYFFKLEGESLLDAINK